MKTFLGFALLGTALWLTWVLGRLTGIDGVIGLLASLIALSLSAWLYGQVQYRTFDRVKVAALAVALIAITSGGWFGLSDRDTGAVANTQRVADDDRRFRRHRRPIESINTA